MFETISVRPQPSSPFKRPLLSSTPCSAETEVSSPATINPRNLHFTPMPAMAEVRSPDVLHPQDGPCDCLSQSLQVCLLYCLHFSIVVCNNCPLQIGFTGSREDLKLNQIIFTLQI